VDGEQGGNGWWLSAVGARAGLGGTTSWLARGGAPARGAHAEPAAGGETVYVVRGHEEEKYLLRSTMARGQKQAAAALWPE
jgi:hypothetical protein